MAKIKAGAYPEEKNWQDWITFNVGQAINLLFLYRLAAYIKAEIGVKTIIGWGLRSIARQAIAYQNYLNGGTLAAKPGASWHNYGLAVDVNKLSTGRYPGTLNADYDLFAASKAETLYQYGLTHTVTGEPWHIQPIETKGWPGDKFAFSDLDDWVNTPTGYPLLQLTEPVRMQGAAVKELQRLLNLRNNAGLPLTGLFGEQTDDALQAFQGAKGLIADGQAGKSHLERLDGSYGDS